MALEIDPEQARSTDPETQPRPSEASTGTVGQLVSSIVGDDVPLRIESYDGSRLGPPGAPARLIVRSPDAIRRVVFAPGELGLARAYVAGDIDIEGDIFAAFELSSAMNPKKLGIRDVRNVLGALDVSMLRPLPPPPEETRPKGRLHSKSRDAAAISHHYDVGNEFYRLLLGPSMTYSCAVWHDDMVGAVDGLERAQESKYELICAKLGLRPGMRLLDVGCGWGGMVRYAARNYGVDAVGITLSGEQQRWARDAVDADGMTEHVEVRVQDYRDVTDGPFDAISSIGMFEHVGRARLGEYFGNLHQLLAPGGRLLNHAISRPPNQGERVGRNGFLGRYVFPDGELIEVGSVITEMQSFGFEARHMEDLREHYALTLRAWVENLEANWDEAVCFVGEGRARVWRLYLAGSAIHFEDGRTRIHQVLGVKLDVVGRSSMPLRPTW